MFAKRILCFLLAAVLVFSLVGCNSKSNYGYQDGKYYDLKTNAEITDVTLDVIAEAHHGAPFKECDPEQRKDTLHRYLNYHSSAHSLDTGVIDAMFNLSVLQNLNEMEKKNAASGAIEAIQSSLSDATSVLPLVHLYADAKGNDALGDFADKVSDVGDVADSVLEIAHTAALILEMSTVDISNPEAYCTQVIAVLQSLMGYIPVFGDFYADALDVVGDGLNMLIKKNEAYQEYIAIHGQELDRVTIFSMNDPSGQKDWGLLAKRSRWESEIDEFHAPTIAGISRLNSRFATMSALELELLEAYVLFRLSHNVENNSWYGYGKTSTISDEHTRFEMNLLVADGDTVRGTLTVSRLYDQICTARFTGTGTDVNGNVEYAIRFQTPVKTDKTSKTTYTDAVLIYNPPTDTYSFQDFYTVTLQRCSSASKTVLKTNEKRAGLGQTGYFANLQNCDDLFAMNISTMSESAIRGDMSITQDGVEIFSSAFQGRGYKKDGSIFYEILLNNPWNTTVNGIQRNITAFRLEYIINRNLFQIPSFGSYSNVILMIPSSMEPDPSTPETTPTETIGEICSSGAWFGYGETYMAGSGGTRYDLAIDSMDKTQIQGTLTRSYLYKVPHETTFTGTGKIVDNKIEYTIHFDIPAELGTIPTFEYEEILLVYDPAADTFTMDDCYSATMINVNAMTNAPILDDVKYSGYGSDSFYNSLTDQGHLFEMDVYHMGESQISGHLTVSYEGKVDHSTEFTGRGYYYNNYYFYEVSLETVRTMEAFSLVFTIDAFWLEYNCATGSLRILSPSYYSVIMMPEG